jgi:hypothetical protein
MQTAAAALINALSPEHRAILYTALNAYEVLHQECLEDLQDRNHDVFITTHLTKAHEYAIANTNTIKKELFAECFVEDLRLEKYILKNIKSSKVAVVS